MNKKFLGLFVLGLLIVSGVAVYAYATNMKNYVKLQLMLVEKNPTTWVPVPKGSYGEIRFEAMGGKFRFDGSKLQKGTSYTLIYYGDETNNDVWPYATCLGTKKTSRYGTRLQITGSFPEWIDFLKDTEAEKFWLVLSDDVDCKAGRMIAWNPTEYLFETITI